MRVLHKIARFIVVGAATWIHEIAKNLSDVVIDRESHYLTSVNIDDKQENIGTLSKNASLREGMGKRAKARAKEMFSPQRQRDDHIVPYKMAMKSFEQR
jgi:hypothetical protein